MATISQQPRGPLASGSLRQGQLYCEYILSICRSTPKVSNARVEGMHTVRVRNTASVMRDLQTAQNELVGPFLQAVQIKAVSNSVWQGWRPPPVCILHCFQLDVCRAGYGAAGACSPSPGTHSHTRACVGPLPVPFKPVVWAVIRV